MSHYIYIISLISACSELVIFLIILISLFYSGSGDVWNMKLKSEYKTVIIHAFIPMVTLIRFITSDIRIEINIKLYEKFSGGLPFIVYSCIMLPLCGAKVFTTLNKNEGDGKIPYGFFDFYHQSWYVCLIISFLIIVFGCCIGIFLDYLNKKIELVFIKPEAEQVLEEKGYKVNLDEVNGIFEKLIELESKKK